MRFGIMVGGYASGITLDGFVETARDLERRGFDTLWIPHVFEHDAVTCAALVGAAVSMIVVLLGAWIKPENFDWKELEEAA